MSNDREEHRRTVGRIDDAAFRAESELSVVEATVRGAEENVETERAVSIYMAVGERVKQARAALQEALALSRELHDELKGEGRES